jgi:predicted ATPase/DNA-binding XRE family transcriptional regulator
VVDERSKRPEFGALLRKRRLAARLTQDELATLARISVQAVSALERGARHAPRDDTLVLLTQALGLEGEALLAFETVARASVKPKIRAKQPLFKTPSRKRADLPRFDTPFFGRERELQELAAAAAGGGCTTLWGTGGVGKTRLALEATALVEDRFDQIAFVGLAAAFGDDSVGDAIAVALGIMREAGDDARARIARELHDRRWLVIVDNCEHVIAGAARIVGTLAAVSPETAFLCTSREPLRIAGERVMNVGALPADDARRLFVDRAQTPAPGGSLSAADRRAVATICRKLDGIPLALELAAACARVLDLEHVVSGLDERFRLLTRGSRAATDRHTTLYSTIAWSYDLLSSSERHVFERAAIFNGSFSLDDLLAIALDETCDRVTVLSALAALVDKSLVVVEGDRNTSQRRYSLLESTRAFVMEAAMARDGDSALVEAHRRLGRHLSDRLLNSIQNYRDGERTSLRDEPLDQLRGYLDWAIEKRHDVAAGTKLAAEIHFVWDLNGLHVEGLRRIEAGLALLADEAANAPIAMIGWYAVSRLKQNFVRNPDSLAPALRAYELAARLGNDLIRAQAAEKTANAYVTMGEREQALAYVEESITLYERLGDSLSAAYAGCTAGIIAFKLRGDAVALERFRRAVERLSTLGEPWRTTNSRIDLAEAYHWFGKTDEAIAIAESTIARLRETASPIDLAVALNNLGAYLTSIGRTVEAVPVAREALEIGRVGTFARAIVLAVQTCATIAALGGRQTRRCAQLFGYVAHRYDRIGENEQTETVAHERLREAVRATMAEHDVSTAVREGEAFDDEAAIEAALRCIECAPEAGSV